LDEKMGMGFRSADLVLARGGASMLGESPAFGVPAILVPYPHAWRYQKVNADYLVSRNAAIRMDDDRMGAELLPTLRDLFLEDRAKLTQMSVAAKGLDQPQASQNIANLLRQMAGKAHG
jgi:UDP-N-acetylglucosamine--N-acetylmuramyl-(pentapeptide) pyrophosphoryl-undecaprenol N-acetylglucosamine transferase